MTVFVKQLSRLTRCFFKGVVLLIGFNAVAIAVPGIEHQSRSPNYATGTNADDFIDMKVSVLGDDVAITRRWVDSTWVWNRRWADLQFFGYTPDADPNATSTGTVSRCAGAPVGIMRNGFAYRRMVDDCGAGDVLYANQPDNTLTALNRGASGFEWRDNRGNKITYDKYGHMISYGDRNGITVSVTRDANGNIKNINDHLGNLVATFTYQTFGSGQSTRYLPDEITDYTGRKVKYNYDANGVLQTVTDVRNKIWTYKYDANKQLAGYLDPDARETKMTLGAKGLVSSIFNADGVGYSFKFNYDATKEEYYQSLTDGEGTVTETWFNSLGQVVRRTINGELQLTATIRLSTDKVSTGDITRFYQFKGVTAGSTSTANVGLINTGAGDDPGYVKTRIETDASGNATTYDYDRFGNVIKEKRADNSVITTTYNSWSQPLLVTESDSTAAVINKTEYVYYANGDLQYLIEAKGFAEERRTEYLYDQYGQLTKQIINDTVASQTPTTEYRYDTHGNLEWVKDPAGYISEYLDFDALGNARQSKDARNKITSKTFDAAGNLLTETDPTNVVLTYSYDNTGYLSGMTIPGSGTYAVDSNASGLPKKLTDRDDNSVDLNFNKRNQLLKLTDAESHDFQMAFDTLGRLRESTDGENNKTVIAYKNMRVDKVTYPTYEEGYGYDNRSRVNQVNRQGEQIAVLEKLGYDINNNVSERIDGKLHGTKYQYDALNRLTTLIDAQNKIVHIDYDARDNIRLVRDGEDRSTHFTYTLRDQLATEAKQNDVGSNRIRRFEYDANGNLQEKINAKGERTVYEYDDANRLLFVRSYANAAATTAAKTVTMSYLPATGQYTGYSDGTQSEAISYDALGRVDDVTVNFGAFSKTYSYTYFKNGQLKTYTSPEDHVYEYAYNGNNQITSVTLANNKVINIGDYQWGQPQTIVLPGAARFNLRYDALQRPKTSELLDSVDNPVLGRYYTHDNADNISAVSTRDVSGDGKLDYVYDDVNRLIDWQQYTVNGELQTREKGANYRYDAVGNRTRQADDATGSTKQTLAYNNHNQLTGIAPSTGTAMSYDYDSNGHTVRKTSGSQITEYGYDLEERLTEVRRGTNLQSLAVIAQYRYDAYGRRSQKITSAGTTYFLYNQAGLAAEYEALDCASVADAGCEGATTGVIGKLIREYHFMPGSPWSTNPLFQRDAQNHLYYYVNDQLGTPQKLVADAGVVVWSASVDAFGLAHIDGASTAINPLRFAGQYFDTETGLHQNYFRDYDPESGRYLQGDPIGLLGGVNVYAYVENNPIFFTDPFGLCDEKKCAGEARVLLGEIDFVKRKAVGAFPGHQYNSTSAAVITKQFGLNKKGMTPYLNKVRGYINGKKVFDNIADRIDNIKSPVNGMSTAEAFRHLNPGKFILELPNAEKDMGIQKIVLYIPVGLPCPEGTVEVK